MTDTFPIWRSLLGGGLIGAGAAVLILVVGRTAGISGILGRLLEGQGGEGGWRVAFIAGLALPALALGTGPIEWQASTPVLAVAGLLVGAGTRVGSGCTSGHGVCGLASLSLRSLVATLSFMVVAMGTVAVAVGWISR